MIKSVMFDMGGTLEDIWVDAESERACIEKLRDMLRGYGLEVPDDYDAFKKAVDDGWAAYGRYRDANGVELKPIPIWRDYVLKSFHYDPAVLEPKCEEIAHMWEVTHYHRQLRPRVREMLDHLKKAGLKLGVISNTAAMWQGFDSLEAYGIRDYFQDVTLSSVTGLRKPGTDIFINSLRELQVEPQESVYVGDTVSRDISGSKRAGFAAAIQIRSRLTKEKDAEVDPSLRPDYVVDDIYDVWPVVKKLIGA